MSEEKGILTSELEDLVVEGLDKLINTKGVVEAASDLAIKLLVPIIDNNVADQLKDEIKLPLRNAGQLIVEKDYIGAAETVSEVISATDICFPGMDETDTQRISRKLANLLADIIQTELKNKIE